MTVIEDLYPSRTGEAPRILERLDPVVHGDGAKVGRYSLEPEQLAFFERNGYLLLEGWFSEEELAWLRAEYERLAADERLRDRPEVISEPDSDAVRSIFAPQRFSALYDRLGRSTRLLDIAMQILGGPVYLHQARINVKPAFVGRAFSWHSDFETWHVEDGLPRIRCLSCSVFLTDNDDKNGPLYVIPGSHRQYVSCAGVTPEDHYRESLVNQRFGSPDPASMRRICEGREMVGAFAPAGSLLVFDGNVMHGSPDNMSPWPRADLFFTYNSVENPPLAPFSGLAPRPDLLSNRDHSPLEPVPFELPSEGGPDFFPAPGEAATWASAGLAG